MSPQSRSRKKKAAGGKAEPQGVGGFCKEILRDVAALGADPDPLDVEVLASGVLGELWDHPEGDELAKDLIDYAGRKVGPASGVLLAGLAALAPFAHREPAAAALRGLVARGLPEPRVAAKLGAATPGECFAAGDVYGDRSTLLCTFEYGESRHGLLAVVDFSYFEPIVLDVSIVENPDELEREMRDQAAQHDGTIKFERLPLARARRLIEKGIVLHENLPEPIVTDDFALFRAVALARCRALPGPEQAEPAAVLPDWDSVVDEFLRETGDVPDSPAVRECARLLIDFGVQSEPNRPLRVSPEKIATFLEDWLPGEAELSDAGEDVLSTVLLAWVRWRGSREGLPEAAVTELLETAEDLLEGGGEVLDAYLDDVPDETGSEEVAAILDRRMFAVPTTLTELGEDELTLDPNDPEQRHLLVVGEHPEFHDALAEGGPDAAEVMEFLGIKAAVVDQLWEGEPAAAWTAACRLREQGAERDEILDKLSAVLAGQLQPAPENELRFDPADYERALIALGDFRP
ncbi:hypothetical protein [Qaidamihabitans albus]|uniref:hypothetical protein n=1 Tax=Qaidamihabitans albus TaxID=2795733 RepID=UPI0018F1B522|nr:hypothetical protein [Qaidamihabitans albus]